MIENSETSQPTACAAINKIISYYSELDIIQLLHYIYICHIFLLCWLREHSFNLGNVLGNHLLPIIFITVFKFYEKYIIYQNIFSGILQRGVVTGIAAYVYLRTSRDTVVS